jgi:hypothetical protein
MHYFGFVELQALAWRGKWKGKGKVKAVRERQSNFTLSPQRREARKMEVDSAKLIKLAMVSFHAIRRVMIGAVKWDDVM